MKFKHLPILLLTLLFVGPVAACAAPATNVSGKIVDGLRLLSIDPSQTENNFVIYRGDYIQPSVVGSSSFEIIIPELKVKKTFPVAQGEKPYIKMKKPGLYNFTAGQRHATIKVIEYSAKHYTELGAAEADKVIKNIQPLILDVRTPGEFSQGHLKNAYLLPVQVLQKKLSTLNSYKDREILIYCATGNRSTVASRILINNGFEKIYNLRYGIKDWAKRKFPTVR
jgi:rhodanese-related sulfurtransferase